MNRESTREKTMQLIFQMDATGQFDYEKLSLMEENTGIINKAQAVSVLTAVRDHIEDIDIMIKRNLENWSFDRVSKADLAVLRTAVAEMMYVDRLPSAVSIDEAVRLARKYGDDKSYAFVNSVLSKIDRELSSR